MAAVLPACQSAAGVHKCHGCGLKPPPPPPLPRGARVRPAARNAALSSLLALAEDLPQQLVVWPALMVTRRLQRTACSRGSPSADHTVLVSLLERT